MTRDLVAERDVSPYAQAVAEEVRGMAARRRISNVRIAEALHVSPMSVSRRMNGRQAFAIDELAVVAQVLGVTIADLLPRDTTPAQPLAANKHGYPPRLPFPEPRGLRRTGEPALTLRNQSAMTRAA